MIDWKEKYAKGGVCDFRENYDFFYKWLTNKVASCFVLKKLPKTINGEYLKVNLILNGLICVTQFKGTDLYACIGNLGGKPDEYYRPVDFTISNPVLGSKKVHIRDFNGNKQDGVIIANTDIDSIFASGVFDCGLHTLINQTATLLADNIVSISCNQINSRVNCFFTADSESQAMAGENILKKMYAGRPYQILRSDLIEKININPLASNQGQTIPELVELHNYIIAQFLQSVGIKANDVRKKERLITDEIKEQDNYIQLSITEMLSSWQKGFDEVNNLFGTDIEVTLNPVLIPEIIEEFTENETDFAQPPAEPESDTDSTDNDVKEEQPLSDKGKETIMPKDEDEETETRLDEQEETLKEVIDKITDSEDGEQENDNSETES